jgi:hypothetical protein
MNNSLQLRFLLLTPPWKAFKPYNMNVKFCWHKKKDKKLVFFTSLSTVTDKCSNHLGLFLLRNQRSKGKGVS